jgi:hypothetical protein
VAIAVIHDGIRIHGIIIFRSVNNVNPFALFQNGDFDTIVKMQGVFCVGVSADVITIVGREIF